MKREKGSDSEGFLRSLEFNYGDWNLGGKLIFYATILAIISVILPWMEANNGTIGFMQGAGFFLVFYVYPFVLLLMDRKIHELVGTVSAGFAVFAPSYVLYYVMDQEGGSLTEIAEPGVIIFIVASMILFTGIHLYESYERP